MSREQLRAALDCDAMRQSKAQSEAQSKGLIFPFSSLVGWGWRRCVYCYAHKRVHVLLCTCLWAAVQHCRLLPCGGHGGGVGIGDGHSGETSHGRTK